MARDLTSPASIGPWGTNRPPALLPCPFCGGPALLDNSGSGSVDGRGNALARVWCPDPDCKTHGTAWLDEWEAVKVWNRRVQP